MMYCCFAEGNEAKLAGDKSGWTSLIQAVSAGDLLIPLTQEVDPYPYDGVAKCFRISLVDEPSGAGPTARFYMDEDSLVFSGTRRDVEWLVKQIDRIRGGKVGTHIHIDIIGSFDILLDGTLELVFQLES